MVTFCGLAHAQPNGFWGFDVVIEAPNRVYLEIAYSYSGVPADAYIGADMGDGRLGQVPDQARVGQNRALVDISLMELQAFDTTQVHLTMYTQQGTIVERWFPYSKKWAPTGDLGLVAHAPKRRQPGQNGSIWVKVFGRDGQPLPNAEVSVRAGGGRFREGGGTKTYGRTNEKGEFVADWSCSPCAAGYSFDIDASVDGRARAATICFVKIE